MRQITHVRYGFATNSSSVHSIMFPTMRLKDKIDKPYQYGWEPFILASRQRKRQYLETIVVANILHTGVPTEFLRYIGCNIPTNAYIDGESLMILPRDVYNQNEISWEFFKEFSDWVMNDEVVIVGGNDNYPDGFSWRPHGRYLERELLDDWHHFKARKNGNYWILFNYVNGTKVRIRFHNEQLTPEFPELVDVNITDYCDIGCPFCYRDATVNGEHALFHYLENLFCALPYGTEIAIGGGDPMLHPQIHALLPIAVDYGLIVNVTVRGTRWLENKKLLDSVNTCVSGLGVSVNSTEDAKHSLSKILEKLNDHIYVVVHYIPSLGSAEDLKQLFSLLGEFQEKYRRFTNLSLLLLGYKTTGRGSYIKPKRIEGLASLVNELGMRYGINIGGDTALFHEYPEFHQLVHTLFKPDREGTFSMYVDAVKQTAYASSYHSDIGVPLLFNSYSSVENARRIQRCFTEIRQRAFATLQKKEIGGDTYTQNA